MIEKRVRIFIVIIYHIVLKRNNYEYDTCDKVVKIYSSFASASRR